VTEVHVHLHVDGEQVSLAKADPAPVEVPLRPVSPEREVVLKESAEQRYVLGVAYQAGRDEKITKGADGARDFITDVELEKTAWGYLRAGAGTNLFHADGTEGHFDVVESYIYRGPDWVTKDVGGADVVVKAGDWLVGAIGDETGWELYKNGHISSWSPQGTATRRRSRST
jgi:hypothetical protein